VVKWVQRNPFTPTTMSTCPKGFLSISYLLSISIPFLFPPFFSLSSFLLLLPFLSVCLHLSSSSNDTFPTAMHVAAAIGMKRRKEGEEDNKSYLCYLFIFSYFYYFCVILYIAGVQIIFMLQVYK
jgi:hypothetical protein